MVRKDEEIERLKHKLWLYGSYTRELEMLEHRYFDIEEELKANDMPNNSAKNLGVHGDAYHPAVEKIKLEEASLIDEMGQKEEEMAYLGLDDFFAKLTITERGIIDEKYVRNSTYRNIGRMISMSKSNTYRTLIEIIEKGTCPA